MNNVFLECALLLKELAPSVYVGGLLQLNLTSVSCECNSSGMMTIQQGEVVVQVGCSGGAVLVQRKCKVLVRCVTHKRHIHTKCKLFHSVA
jgi:hypothetical protein